jgi:hypothetical protein
VTTSDIVMVIAVVLGPILAVQAQKWIELLREDRNRRLFTFKRLMATRGATLSPGHVEALNMIDLEFNGKNKKDEQVRRRWKEYLDHLGSLSQDPKEKEKQADSWRQRNGDLLAELLHDMGVAVGYDFDKVHIRRGIYSPLGHLQDELEGQGIRRGLLQVLSGERALPMNVVSLPNMPPPPSASPSASGPKLPAE